LLNIKFDNQGFFKLKQGNATQCLQSQNNIVLSEKMAQKYFGNENPIGKIISLKDDKNPVYKVTGLIDKVPVNSNFHFELFASMASLPESREPTWMSSNFFTYLVLAEGYDYKKLEAKFPGMVEKYMGPQIQQQMGLSLEQFRTKGNELGFILQPLTSIHLYSETNAELEPGGNANYVYIFGGIAIFMLIVACINFINLSTASASKRAKEVGVRKVAGSDRFQLIRQFLSESLLITMVRKKNLEIE
jgi:putative ABC transport system permease protein